MKRDFIAVYILSNKYHGTIYTGVTSNLPRRIWEHKSGHMEGFSKRYGLKRIVYFECFYLIKEAIKREKEIKGWDRERRVKLIEETNSSWEDLWDEMNGNYKGKPKGNWIPRSLSGTRDDGLAGDSI